VRSPCWPASLKTIASISVGYKLDLMTIEVRWDNGGRQMITHFSMESSLRDRVLHIRELYQLLRGVQFISDRELQYVFYQFPKYNMKFH
jgi:hypothetical protein